MSLGVLLEQLRLRHVAAALPGWLERGHRGTALQRRPAGGVWKKRRRGRVQDEIQRRLRQAAFPFAATAETTADLRCPGAGRVGLPVDRVRVRSSAV